MQQGGFQLLGILVTVLIAIVTGLLTGFYFKILFNKKCLNYFLFGIGLLLKSPSMRKLKKDEQHDDSQFWEVPEPEIITA